MSSISSKCKNVIEYFDYNSQKFNDVKDTFRKLPPVYKVAVCVLSALGSLFFVIGGLAAYRLSTRKFSNLTATINHHPQNSSHNNSIPSRVNRVVQQQRNSNPPKKLTELSREKILEMFPRHLKSEEDNEANKRQFSQFTVLDIQEALKKDLLDDHHHWLFSDEQLLGLSASDIARIKFGAYLEVDKGANKQAFSKLNPEEIQKVLYESQPSLPFPVLNGDFLTDQHLRGLNLLKVPKKVLTAMLDKGSARNSIEPFQAKFKNFEPENVAEAFKKGKFSDIPNLLELMTDKQLEAIKLSDLEGTQIDFLFPSISLKDFSRDGEKYLKKYLYLKKRFSVFAHEDVQAALKDNKLTREQLQFLSDEQIHSLNISNLPPKVLFKFYPRENEPERPNRLSNAQQQEANKILEGHERNIQEEDHERDREFLVTDDDKEFFRNFEDFAKDFDDAFFKIFNDSTDNDEVANLKNRLFEILGLEPTASDEKIRKAKRKFLLNNHPDKLRNMKQLPEESDDAFHARRKKKEELCKEFLEILRRYEAISGAAN